MVARLSSGFPRHGGASAVLWALTLVGIAVKRDSKGRS